MARALILSCFCGIASLFGCSSKLTYQAPAEIPDDIRVAVEQAMRPSLQDRELVGVAVGILKGGRRHVFGYGATSAWDGKPVDNQTIFEIGSITKTFTSLALAQMVLDGTLSLEQPAQGLLPGVTFPDYLGQHITLRHLASHTSGLPYMPPGLNSSVTDINPYDDYTPQELHAWVNGHALTAAPGARYEYSNAGFALLGQLLATQDGISYEALVAKRVTAPLGMPSTGISLRPEQAAHLADAHFLLFNLAGLSVHLPMPPWRMPAFQPAGEIRSNIDDMLTYLAAAMGADTPLHDAFALSTEQFFEVAPNLTVGLGWHAHIAADGGAPIIWHNGATGGFTSFLGYIPGAELGVVILANTLPGLVGGGVDQQAIRILESLAGRRIVDNATR